MTTERWGAFSVIDHKNTELLVPEVLLYDRLVIPYPSDGKEKKRWSELGWTPELLDKRLEQLDKIAITVPWNEDRRQQFKERMQQLKAYKFDAQNIVNQVKNLPYQTTRMILAQDDDLKKNLPSGIDRVNIVSAYQSEHDFRNDYVTAKPKAELANLCLLIGHQIAVPSDMDPNEALSKAIKLAENDDFKKRRRNLYRWQENAIRNGIQSYDAVNDLDELIKEYNNCVKNETKKLRYRYAVTIGSIAVSTFGALLHDPITTIGGMTSSIGSAISLAQLFSFDRKPVINAGDAEPAAMFHEIDTKVFSL